MTKLPTEKKQQPLFEVVYKNLQGEIVSNPLVEIKALNKEIAESTQDIKHLKAKHQTLAYTALYKKLNIGVCELPGPLEGGRFFQEDNAVIGLIDEFASLEETDRCKVGQQTLKKLNAKIDENNLHGGTCLCVAIVVGNRIYSTHVGDSTAFLVSIDTNEKAKLQELNKILHHPSHPEEFTRLKSLEAKLGKKIIFNERLMGQLAVTQALGDFDFQKYGLVCEGEHHVDTVSSNEKTFLIVACDGLTENYALDASSIEKMIEENHTKSPDEIAKILAVSANKNGSKDNITVIIMRIDPAFPHVRYAVVLDGHGGYEVSEYVSSIYHETIHEVIESIKKFRSCGFP